MDDLPLDDDTAERLLSGRLSPDDAPPGYARVAAVLLAAGGPGGPAERREEASVVRVAATHVHPVPDTRTEKEKPMRRGLLPIKVAAASAIGALGLATVAAAVGVNLTADGHHHAAHHPSTVSAPFPRTLVGAGSTSGTTGSSGGGSTSAVGPTQGMKMGHATFGLCTAFLAGRATTGTTGTGATSGDSTGASTSGGSGGSSTSGRTTSPAFRALIAAGGGTVTSTKAFCTTYVTNHKPGAHPHPTSVKNTMPPATGHPTSSTHPGPTSHPTPTTHPGRASHPTPTTHPGA